MRALLDIRLSRVSLILLTTVSLVATFVIVSTGNGKTPAEMAALVALRQRPSATAPAERVVPTAPGSSAATSSGDESQAGGGGGSPAGSDASSSPSQAGSDSAGSSDDGSSGDDGSSSDSGDSGGSSSGTASGQASAASTLPKVGHVFEIALSTTSYAAAFGHGSAAPYLRSLTREGTLLGGYESLGSSELADNLAMISGQPPNADTRSGCTTYAEFPTAVVARANGLVPGKGCVYPETALTLGDQVSATGHVWKAYVEDQGKETCAHPNSGAVDDLALPGAEPSYDTRHNPFIYFHSLLDLGDCATDDQDLTHLPAALATASKTATFSLLAPSACSDARAVSGSAAATGSPTDTTSTTTTGTTSTTTSSSSTTTGSTSPSAAPTPTTVSSAAVSGASGAPTAAACPAGPVGVAAEDAFLKLWVPRILRSPAYRKDGVLVIAFAGDGVKPSGPHVRTGALVLSRYAHKGKTIATAYSPYSLLRSVEDMLGYTPLAQAKSAASFAATTLSKTK